MRAVSAIHAALRAGLDALRLPGLARVQAAWALGYVADTALTVLLAVVAFERFGPAGVALVGAARTLPATIVGLTAAAPMARWSAREVIIGIDVIRVGAAAGTALALAAGAPPVWTFAVAAAMGVAAAIARPAHLTILPALARTPADLVAANVGTTSGEAIGSFIGPMTAAAFLLAGTPIAIAAVAAVAPALAIGGLLGLRFEDVASEREERRRTDPGRGGGLRLAAGARALARRPAVAVVVAAFALQTAVRGLLGPLIVVVSTELVGLGEPGVGYLTAALGVGGAIGMFAGLVLGRSDGRAFSLALAAWGAPIILIGLVPVAPVAIAALALVGLANALLDIIGFTILQRGSRNDERAPIFSILEGSVGLGTTIGSVAAPPLIVAIGVVPALVATGAILPAGAVLVGLAFRRLGQTEIVTAATIDRLRAVPAFGVLPLTAIERLAGCGERVTFGPGESLMREGEPGDRFLLLESGTVEVTAAGKPLDRLGPGTGLGEIALLRGIPRTATITAIEPVVALAFDSQAFVTAVSGPAATAAATRMVEERLARTARDG